ncbi:FAD-dependent monooxygenase [Lacisediminihabitans sp.]|uniref:FAD-dependent monooxygenase n=1 Tax=Lacisediminihabitans sp. TaxID=2787631 RepID=UPI00374CC549
MKNTSILISGAGIAGPALAFLLRQRGFTPTVVERAPEPRPGGQAVDLRGAGRTVIEMMGLMDRVKAVSLDQRGIAFVGSRGKVDAWVPKGLFGGEGFVSEIEVLRGDLGRLLYDATMPEVEYLFDDTITGIAEDAEGVQVSFETAAARRFDLVVGADGLHSRVRALAFGEESEFVRPLNCYTAWFTASADFALDGWYLMHNAPGGLVASVRPGRVAGEAKAGFSFRSAPLEFDRRDIAAQKDIVASRFERDGWLTPALLGTLRDSTDFSFDSLGQVHLDHWSRGRIVLLGDAGYCPTPLTGLGTSLALVGAWVLAGELAQADGDHSVAFRRYDEVMRPYVTQGQELAPGGVASFAPISALAIALRNASMRWMGRWPMRPMMAKQFAKAGGIALPTYPVPVS